MTVASRGVTLNRLKLYQLISVIAVALFMGAGFAYGATQNVAITPANYTATAGEAFTLNVAYSTSDDCATTSGVALLIYYNSSIVTFNSFSNVFASSFPTSDPTPKDDTGDGDGDTTTDKYVTIGWADFSNNWPGAGNTGTFNIVTLNFTASTSNVGASAVNVRIDMSSIASDCTGTEYVPNQTDGVVTIPDAGAPAITALTANTTNVLAGGTITILEGNSVDLAATVSDVGTGDSNITDARYAIGASADPTTGTPMNGGAEGVTRDYTATISGLAVGTHTIKVAGKDTANWSAVKTFTVTVNANQGPNASSVQLSGQTALTVVKGITTTVDLTALLTDPEGHQMDAAKPAEWFWSPTDPGTGSANPMTLTGANGTTDVAVQASAIDISALAASATPYTINVRGQDEHGAWGAVAPATLTVNPNEGPEASSLQINGSADPFSFMEGTETTIALSAVISNDPEGHNINTTKPAEWYLGSDPGQGLAHPMTTAGTGTSVTAEDTAVDVSALTAAGSPYTIYVRGQDEYGAWGAVATVQIAVQACDATAAFTPPATAKTGEAVTFVNESAETGDAVGTATYDWDFDGNGTNDQAGVDKADQTYTYTAIGTYTPKLTAHGTGGCSTTDSDATIEVTCDAVAELTSTPAAAGEPSVVTVVVNGEVIFDASTSLVGTGMTGTYVMDFGDGTATVNGTMPITEAFPAHPYMPENATGYTAKLTITSQYGCTSEKAITVVVLPCDAQAAFTVSGHVTAAETPITFTNTTVETGDAAGTATYSWAVTGTSAETVTTASLAEAPAFTFMNTPGVYEVTLTATGSTGCTTTFGPVTIYVNDPACEPTVGSSIVTEPAAVEPNPLTVAPNTDVNFSILAADGVDLTGDTFAWNFGDGSAPVTTETAVHQYTAEGTYTVILAVTEAAPGTCVWYSEATIEVVCDVTTASFTAAPNPATVSATVTFTNTSTGPAVDAETATYAWDFGDGTPINTETNPTHAYTAIGAYTVKMTAAGSGCSKDAEELIINVNDATCDLIAGFTAPMAAVVGQTVTFINNSAGAAVTAGTATYAWTFGNGATSTLASPTNIYTTAGTYTVSMTVTDPANTACTKTLSKSITITTGQPTASVTAAFSANVTTGMAPLTVNFTDSSTASNCTLSGWSWNFGDGGTSTEKNPAHTYTNPGVYNVSLTASCPGASNTVTKTAYITVTGCTASFTATGTGNALEVLFDASASGNAVAYEWDFGDGTGGQGVSGTHTYAAAGTYTVKLKVTGASEDCVGVAERRVIVSETCVASAYFTAAPSESQASPFPIPLPGLNTLTVNFDAEGSTGDTFAWEFGDGNTGTGKQASHTYAAAGTYNVTLTVTGGGCSVSSTQRVNVGSGCVADASFTAFTAANSLSVTFSANSSTGTSYAWAFGDGTTASGMSANHTYAASGTYNVTLTVTSGTCTDSTTQTVTVQTEACPAVATFTGEDIGSLTVSFDTTGSSGSLLFDYGDGQIGTARSYTYAQAGTYTVKLTATSSTVSGSECSAVFSAEVTVTECAAKAVFTASVEGLTATFNTSGSVGTLLFAYGDGAGGTDATHTYSAPGTYEVVLTATGSDGCTRETSHMVTTVVCDVVAAFTAQPVEGSAPLTVTFDAGESVGETFAWDFGDGTGGSGETAAHEYTAAGTYTVVLTVSDGNCTATNQAVIYVTEECTVVAIFTAQPEQGTLPLAVTFNAAGSIGETFAWDFGDGATGTGKTATHTYNTAGTHTVTLTVGGCGTATLQKTVRVVLPSADRPDAPVLTEPADGMVDVILQAILKTGAFRSPVNAGHGRTVWQIAADPDFSEMVFSLISGEELTSLTLPESLLNPGTSYYWRVRFIDANGLVSDWSEVFTFVTPGVNQEDLNGNGVPDSQEVTSPPWVINGLWVKVLTGEGYIGLEGLEGVEDIGWFKWLDVRTSAGLPGIRFPWGQFTWKLKASAKTVKVKVHFSSAMPQDALWYNYNLQKGWRDLTDMVEFAPDMKSVTITFTDGGADDADGVENGWIVDPAGFGVVETTTTCCEDKSDGGSCFVETAASGKVLAGLVLMLISGLSLLAFRKSQR